MKHALTILCFLLATSLDAAERDAPVFRAFPNPGSDWSIADDRQVGDGQFSWRHYMHEKTGDVIAIVAWHTPRFCIDSGAVRQASIETITSSGYAYAKTRKLGQPIDDTVRHHVASIIVKHRGTAQKNIYRAIEYTYIYESADGESRSAMAHGYVVHIGEFTVFIQHTANRVITSDIAQSMAMDLAFVESNKLTPLPNGWSASISR